MADNYLRVNRDRLIVYAQNIAKTGEIASSYRSHTPECWSLMPCGLSYEEGDFLM